MNLVRLYGLILAAASRPERVQRRRTGHHRDRRRRSDQSASAYTGPSPATADVQAFSVNFWSNVRVQNRCGQCHNATSPAQMPNFARSDDVNLAYAQANTVVDLQQPSAVADRGQGQRRPQLLAVGPQRLRSDPDHLDLQLGRCSTRHRDHAGAAGGTALSIRRPEQQFPGLAQ